ncbi:alkylhydroperoxidase [Pseudomonas sp. BAY1663]|nr:alkylhydroperoxidase [Pseudomonas sp. BAY1663]
MTQPISRFPLAESLDALPQDVRERILAVQAKAGFVPMCSSCWHTAPTSSAPSSPTTMR